jgi:protein O-mannosyl-transferase
MKKREAKTRPVVVKKPSVLVPLTVLCAIGIIAYWNSFDVPLVFDDMLSIQRNAGVQFGDYLKISSLFNRSVLYFTFALNYKFGGQDVWGYHFVNLLLHLVNGILIYFIGLQLFTKVGLRDLQIRLYSLLSAAAFVAHPIQTESVTYISSRSELLSTALYLIPFLLFIRRPIQKIGFVFSLIIGFLFLLGIGAKETVISLPAVVFLYDWLFLSNARIQGPLQRWRFYMTFLIGAVGTGYYLVTRTLVGSIGSTPKGHLSAWHYLLTETRVIVRYMQLVIFPAGLNLDYDFRPSESPLEVSVLVSGVIIIGTLAAAFYLRRRKPLYSFSIFWFFLTLAPTSSFVPILDVIFEHRLYLPIIGLCFSFPFLLASSSEFLQSKLALRWKPATLGVVAVMAWMTLTAFRNQVWRDEVTLWKDVAAKSPHKERSYSALFYAYERRNAYQLAVDSALTGAKNVPRWQFPFYEMASKMYLAQGRHDEGLKYLTEIVKGSHDADELARAYNNIGSIYLNKAQKSPPGTERELLLDEAENAFRKSTETGSFFFAFDSYVQLVHDRGKGAKLLQELQAKLGNNQDFQPLYGLGKLNLLDRNYQAAAEYFDKAEKLDPSEKLLFFQYGSTLAALNENDAAVQKFIQAIRLDPVFLEGHYNVAVLYMKQNDFADAISHLQEVLHLDPNYLLAHLNLAKIYLQQGQKSLARQHLSTVLSISPGNPQATALLRQVGS